MQDKDDAGWFPIHTAASAGQDETVKALLGRGAQMNAVNQNGSTLLHYAASRNRYKIAILLLEGGANPDAKDYYEATAMHQVADQSKLKTTQQPQTSKKVRETLHYT